MEWVMLCLAAGIGYLLGSINAAVIVSRSFNNSDVRTHGSGNAGATNMLRTFGIKSALATTIIDLAKGMIACLAGGFLLHFLGGRFGYTEGSCIAGAFAVIGHNWPVYFGFRGGKGVMTAFAVMLMIAPLAALSSLIVFVIVVLISRYVSLGSILAALTLPGFTALFLFVFHRNILSFTFFVSVFLALLVIIRHHANIGRLIKGTENKFSIKRKDNNDNTVKE